jgi:hypothetical protein
MIYQIKLPATTIVVVDQNDESGRTFLWTSDGDPPEKNHKISIS